MRARVLQTLAAMVVAAGWVVCIVGLVLVDMGRLPAWPWQIISGVIGMFASFAVLVIAFAHAVLTPSE